jgi:hypothetical protein
MPLPTPSAPSAQAATIPRVAVSVSNEPRPDSPCPAAPRTS